jgi:hypothetical protein
MSLGLVDTRMSTRSPVIVTGRPSLGIKLFF